MSDKKQLINSYIYIVGSLAEIPSLDQFSDDLECLLKDRFITVNRSWIAHGPNPDKEYCDWAIKHKLNYREALEHSQAKSTFEVDKKYIENSIMVIMFQPCGKSAAWESGYAIGIGKPVIMVKPSLTEYDRIDIMENFASFITSRELFFDKDWEKISVLINLAKFHVIRNPSPQKYSYICSTCGNVKKIITSQAPFEYEAFPCDQCYSLCFLIDTTRLNFPCNTNTTFNW